MTKPLRFDDEAAEELQVAASWYEQRRRGLGGELLAAVQVAGWIQLVKGNVHLGVAVVLATKAMDIVGALMAIAQTSTNLPVATLRRP